MSRIQWHALLLDGKQVYDDALPELERIKELIPEKLHSEFDAIICDFEQELARCDTRKYYKEIEV